MNQPMPPVPAHPEAPAEVVLREERLHVGRERVPIERVRFTKRVETEVRTVEVQVRREVLYAERLPADAAGTATGAAGTVPAAMTGAAGPRSLEFVLSEEVPVVGVQVRPVEQVRVWVEEIVEQVPVEADLRHEEVDVDTSGTTGPDATRGVPRYDATRGVPGFDPSGRLGQAAR